MEFDLKSIKGKVKLGAFVGAIVSIWPILSSGYNWYWPEYDLIVCGDLQSKTQVRLLIYNSGKRELSNLNVEFYGCSGRYKPLLNNMEEDYFENQAYLGMEILSKPYGYFEDERVKEASPPGMAYVGNKKYGEWRNDPGSGRSFWYYYGIYSFLNRGPGHYYYRGGWSQWRTRYRNREPYFGGTAATGPVYGSYGRNVRTDRRYQNTAFAGRGGFRAQSPSVRGAGPARRGGGPGGKGK